MITSFSGNRFNHEVRAAQNFERGCECPKPLASNKGELTESYFGSYLMVLGVILLGRQHASEITVIKHVFRNYSVCVGIRLQIIFLKSRVLNNL